MRRLRNPKPQKPANRALVKLWLVKLCLVKLWLRWCVIAGVSLTLMVAVWVGLGWGLSKASLESADRGSRKEPGDVVEELTWRLIGQWQGEGHRSVQRRTWDMALLQSMVDTAQHPSRTNHPELQSNMVCSDLPQHGLPQPGLSQPGLPQPGLFQLQGHFVNAPCSALLRPESSESQQPQVSQMPRLQPTRR